MRSTFNYFIILLFLVLLSGCIVSVTPDTGGTIILQQGEKQLFTVLATKHRVEETICWNYGINIVWELNGDPIETNDLKLDPVRQDIYLLDTTDIEPGIYTFSCKVYQISAELPMPCQGCPGPDTNLDWVEYKEWDIEITES